MANTKVIGDLIASGTITATNLADGAVTAAKLNTITTSSITEGTRLYYTDARVGSYLSANGYDTSTNIIAAITDSAPTTLDTLNELAAALGDDPNFATTITTSIATKLPLAGGTLTGNLGIGVTPSAWSLGNAIEISGGPSILGVGNSTQISNNAYYNSGWIYKATSFAQNFVLDNDGSFKFNQATSGTAGNAVSFTTAMKLNASGNLSIGNTNDSYKLDVSGTGRFTASANTYGGGSLILSSYTGGYNSYITSVAGYLAFSNGGGADHLLIDTSGAATFSDKVGIKRIPANAMFEIEEGGLSGAPLFRFVGNAGNGNYMRGAWMQSDNSTQLAQLSVDGTVAMYFGTNSSTPLIITTSGSERMRVTSAGLIGIGTTDPQTHLHVSSSQHTKLRVSTTGVADASVEIQGYDAGLHIGDATNGNRWAIWNDGVGTSSSLKIGSYALGAWYADSSQAITIGSGGNVGIGTTGPTEKLHIYQGTGNGPEVKLQNSSTIYFFRAYTDRLNILAFYGVSTYNEAISVKATNGYVGINTTSPSYRLDVGGDARATGNLISDYRLMLPNMTIGYWDSTYNRIESGSLRPLFITAYSQPIYMGRNGSIGDFTLNTDGNIGIGTANPSAKLHVVGNLKELTTYAEGGKYGKKIILTGSNFDNPTVDIVTINGNTNSVLIAKVTVFQTAYGSQSANVHSGIGYKMGQTTGAVTGMTVEHNGGISSVGTLAWSGNTLQYTTNRVSNYDGYTILVEIAGQQQLSTF
jgi:hypothetical protein